MLRSELTPQVNFTTSTTSVDIKSSLSRRLATGFPLPSTLETRVTSGPSSEPTGIQYVVYHPPAVVTCFLCLFSQLCICYPKGGLGVKEIEAIMKMLRPPKETQDTTRAVYFLCSILRLQVRFSLPVGTRVEMCFHVLICIICNAR